MKAFAATAILLATTVARAAAPHVDDGVLVDDHGMTLYTFGGNGPPDQKSCEGNCAKFPACTCCSRRSSVR